MRPTRYVCLQAMHAARRSVGVIVAASSHGSSSRPAVLGEQHRCLSFKMPFTSGGRPAAPPAQGAGRAADATPVDQRQQSSAAQKAQQTADLQNERLVDSCLEILELCGGPASGEKPRLEIDAVSKETLWELADVILHDFRRPLWEQFDLIYAAQCLPVAREDRQLQRTLETVLESILPQSVYRMFEGNDLYLWKDDEGSAIKRDVLLAFVHALLGNVNVPNGVLPEEVLLVRLADFKQAFPAVAVTPAFRALEHNAAHIAMQTRLYALLSQLCVEFDRERTGKVLLSELQETANRVLGDDQGNLLLAGAPVDADGRIAYAQLSSLLTRPSPVK